MDDRRLLGVPLGIPDGAFDLLVGLFGELNLPNQIVINNF
jgi:hypothetical protein